ncbi:hypothetical protein D9M68_287400 [compost metagenome]
MTGTVRMTVESDAPSAMLTTACMRLASAARIAVMTSGEAEITATTMAVTAGGAPLPFRPEVSSDDITSASTPINTMPRISITIDGSTG